MPWFSKSNQEGSIADYADDGTTGMATDNEEARVEDASEMRYPSPENTSAADGTEIVRQETGFTSAGNSEVPGKDGYFISKPYKREIVAQQLIDNGPGSNRRMAVISALRDLGVKVFIIESKSIQTTADILHHVRRVVGFVARENRYTRYAENMSEDLASEVTVINPLGFQRCLLYQDKTGRLFNLILAPHAMGPAAKFEDYLDSFSGLQALIALTIMMRTFSCIPHDSLILSLKPTILALIFGLVLTEEISLSWLNASMLIKGSPSVAAHSVSSLLSSDIFRKAVILCLALAGAATGRTQKGLTILGVAAACALFLSNLGSRAWYFMGWKPLPYQGIGSTPLAWIVSVLMGAIFPFMAHRRIHVGGKTALEHIIVTAVVVGIVFIAAGIAELQRFSNVALPQCDHGHTYFAVGGWLFATFFTNLIVAFRMTYYDLSGASASDVEPLLLKDHASPVGFKVPSLPDFEMDPSLAWKGCVCFTAVLELIVGICLAGLVGGFIIYLGFYRWDEVVVSQAIKSGSAL